MPIPFENILITVFATTYLVDATINSTILVHIHNLFRRSSPLYTRADLRDWLMEKSPSWLFDLLHCPLCLSFHISWWLMLSMLKYFPSIPVYIVSSLASAFFANLIYGWQHKVREVKTIPTPVKAPERSVDNRVQSFLGKHYAPVPREDGTTAWELAHEDQNKDSLMQFFDTNEFCTDPYCFGLKSAYEEELAQLHIAAARDKKMCSQCAINSLKNKYYNKLKTHLDASIDRQVS